ncbi:MAG: universal stress protein [Methanosarcinaceae archaeon]|nr:universal stress protein [Methanosarcinaceae archaeon]
MTAKKYSRIMIATDGSENSTKAIASGMGLAEQLGSTVYAVFVVPTNMASSMPVGSRMTRWEVPYDIMKEEGVKATSYVQEIGNSTGVDVKPILLEGHPSDELIKFANDNAIDMIVVGTLGRTGIERFLLGSVAENVVRHSNVEVLVVR